MSYFIDTQVLLWLEESPEKISPKASAIIFSPEPIFVSIASVWEIAIKRSLNKLKVEKSTEMFINDFIRDYSSKLITIELKDVLLIENLPNIHRDPFDRMLAAQCINRSIPLISIDTIFDQYSIQRIW
jgi:PIN domain nuclease of toxin-antitoxin system